MTTASPPDSVTNENSKKQHAFDPDHYRMTIGEHLEELRSRLIKGLVGFIIALIFCLIFARQYVIPFFCQPLYHALQANGVSPQLVTDTVMEGFMVYMTVSLLCATAVASPWFLYQLWQFIAAGLYPHERKYVTRYMPLSIILLISGMLFVYFLVLPMMLKFLIGFSIGIPLPDAPSPAVQLDQTVTTQPVPDAHRLAGRILVLPGNPADPVEGMIWFDTVQQRVKIFLLGQMRVISFGSDELIRPEITLASYITQVIFMLLSVGIAFQLPLVVLAIERIGIVQVDQLRSGRRYVYFILVVLSAIISPGDYITLTVALVIPLILLYELGIWLCTMGRKEASSESA